jgi:hypothetical protein
MKHLSETIKEIRLVHRSIYGVWMNIHCDSNNRIIEINPYKGKYGADIVHSFHKGQLLTQTSVELTRWCDLNGFRVYTMEFQRPLKGSKLIKAIIKRGGLL